MAIYAFAGHHLKDPGAVYGNRKENQYTMKIRNRVVEFLKEKGITAKVDRDSDTLSQTISRIKPGSGSVLVEFHLDSSGEPEEGKERATGTSAFYSDNANKNSKELAKEFVDTTSKILGIKNRGALSEKKSNRGRLAILHTAAGIAVLVEVGFINNDEDMKALDDPKKFDELCKAYADLLEKADKLAV